MSLFTHQISEFFQIIQSKPCNHPQSFSIDVSPYAYTPCSWKLHTHHAVGHCWFALYSIIIHGKCLFLSTQIISVRHKECLCYTMQVSADSCMEQLCNSLEKAKFTCFIPRNKLYLSHVYFAQWCPCAYVYTH